MIDFPGKIASVVYLPGCNFNCGSCHARKILETSKRVDQGEILKSIKARSKWIDGVVILGGEPTEQNDVSELALTLKENGFSVKLDTNGSNPEVIKDLVDNNLVDYVAMDVKAPKELYSSVAGVDIDTARIESGMKETGKAARYEFRTTVVPILNGESQDPKFMTVDQAVEIAKWIVDVTGRNDHSYVLQKFVPRKDGLIDKKLENMTETPYMLVEEMKKAVKEYLPNCSIKY